MKVFWSFNICLVSASFIFPAVEESKLRDLFYQHFHLMVLHEFFVQEIYHHRYHFLVVKVTCEMFRNIFVNVI